MKCTTAPFFGSDIGDGFSEVPAVAVKILSIVLALAIGLLLRFRQDDGSILSRALAVTMGIFDANLNDLRIVGRHVSFGDGEAALAGLHLDAVIGDAEPDGEAKGLCQPISCRRGVGINEHRNHGAGRHRSVESHLETLSLNQRGNLERSGRRSDALILFSALILANRRSASSCRLLSLGDGGFEHNGDITPVMNPRRGRQGSGKIRNRQ